MRLRFSFAVPPGWEQKLAPDGRLYYIDHNTRQTHWNPPAPYVSNPAAPPPFAPHAAAAAAAAATPQMPSAPPMALHAHAAGAMSEAEPPLAVPAQAAVSTGNLYAAPVGGVSPQRLARRAQ